MSSNLSKKTVRGTTFIFLAEALVLPTGFLTAIFLTRKLGPEAYGLLTLTATIVAWISWSITSIFTRTTIKFVSATESWQPIAAKVLQLHILLGCISAALLCFFSPTIASILNEPNIKLYLLLASLEIPLFSLTRAHRGILIGVGDFSKQALASSVRWVARLIFIITLIEMGLSVKGAIGGGIAALFCELMVIRIYIRPPLFCRSNFPFRKFLGYALPLFLYSLSMRMYDKVDLISLKLLGGSSEEVGFYGAAQNLSLAPGIFALSFSPLILSSISRAIKDGHLGEAKVIAKNSIRIVIALVPFAVVVATEAPGLVPLLFGETFFATSIVLKFLILGAIAQVMISVVTSILTAADRPNWAFFLTGPLVPLVIISHCLLIPYLGIKGGAIASMSVSILGAVSAVIALQYIWCITLPFSTLLRSVSISCIVYLISLFWVMPSVFLLIKTFIVFLMIPVLFFLLKEFDASEIKFLRLAFIDRIKNT